jgi:hypothetical protein
VIEFEDGRVYREESKDMAERIRAGKLLEGTERTESPRRHQHHPACLRMLVPGWAMTSMLAKAARSTLPTDFVPIPLNVT